MEIAVRPIMGTITQSQLGRRSDPPGTLQRQKDPRRRSHPRCILREVSCQETGTAPIIGVIGQCTVSSCSRQAARHVVLRTRRSVTISGVVCEHCAQATTLAAFLLDLLG